MTTPISSSARACWALALVLLVGACAGRSVPPSWGGALAPAAPVASVAPFGRMLLADPPLPGESTEGWLGLDEPPPAASSAPDNGAHHHGH